MPESVSLNAGCYDYIKRYRLDDHIIGKWRDYKYFTMVRLDPKGQDTGRQIIWCSGGVMIIAFGCLEALTR